MAEFVDVMKQYNRMYKAHKKGVSIPIEASYETAIKKPEFFEKVVMSWATEHPEPAYPLWGEWLMSIGAAHRSPTGVPFQLKSGEIIDPPYEIVVNLYDPIPADTAEKLGIEPKEG